MEAAGEMKADQIKCGSKEEEGEGDGEKGAKGKKQETVKVVRVPAAEEEDKQDQVGRGDGDLWCEATGELFLQCKQLVE